MAKIFLPKVINLPITEICDSKCIMCNVWSAGKTDEFTPESIIKVFGQSYFKKVKHVGISGGEPTLNSNLLEICKSLLIVFPKLKTLSMTSHGYHLDKHEILLPQIKRECEQRNVSFSLNLSVDGIEEIHIKVRRIKDAFNKVVRTANFAKSIGIHVQLQCTITPINVYNIVEVREYALRNNFEIVFRIASYIARLSNGNLKEDIKLSFKERSFVADFLESNRTIMACNSLGRRLFYQDLAKRLKDKSERKAPCSFQKDAIFVSPDETIFNCSRSEQQLKINNVHHIEKEINSPTNQSILDNLIKDTCTNCYHDQSGRWPLWRYLTVHNYLIHYFQLFLKLLKSPRIVINSFAPIKTENFNLDNSFKKIFIIGCYGGEHVGDAAILGGVILRLQKKYGSNDFVIGSIRQDRTKCWVENLEIENTSISVVDSLKKIDYNKFNAVCLAGGPLMGIPTLLSNHLSIIKDFRKNNLPFIVDGIGIGPLPTYLTRKMGFKILELADTISVRTDEDFKKARIKQLKVVQGLDPAFDYLNFRRGDIIDTNDLALKKICNTKKDVWVINIRPLWKTYASKNSELGEIENNVLKILCETLIKFKDNRRFVFMPMNADQYGFSDLEISYKLKKLIEMSNVDLDYIIWETEPDIDSCIYLLKQAKLTISMRFHGCIFSLANNIPTIGIDYSTSEQGKVQSLFKSLNIENQAINIAKMESILFEEMIKKVI